MVEHEDDYPEHPVSVIQDTPPGSPGQMDNFRVQKQMMKDFALARTPDDCTDEEYVEREARRAMVTGQLQAQMFRETLKAMGVAPQQPSLSEPNQEEQQETIVPPQNGGIVVVSGYPTAWTGGCNVDGYRLDGPRTPNCYRPKDVKNSSRMHEFIQKGMKKERALGMPPETTHKKMSMTLHDWIVELKDVLEDRGLEGPFLMIHDDGRTVTNLLQRYGDATIEKVTAWSQRFQRDQDEYDEYNLKIIRLVILGSLDNAMNKKIRQQVGENTDGLILFAHIVNYHQSLSIKAVNHILLQLNKQTITKEPGLNFETFGDKIKKYAQMVEAIGTPREIGLLPKYVIDTYHFVQDVQMQQIVTNITMEIEENRGRYVNDWELIISYLKQKYRERVQDDRWMPGFQAQEPYGLNALSTVVSQPVVKESNEKTKGNTFRLTPSNETRKCHNCGKVGHLKANCPDSKKKKQNGGGKPKSGGKPFVKKTQKNGGPKEKGVLVEKPPKKAPKSGQSEIVHTKDGKVYYWCGICHRWTFGARAHPTDKHIKGGPPRANIAAEDNDDSVSDDDDAGGVFRLASGLSYTAVIPRQSAIKRRGKRNHDSDKMIRSQDQPNTGLMCVLCKRDTGSVKSELQHKNTVTDSVEENESEESKSAMTHTGDWVEVCPISQTPTKHVGWADDETTEQSRDDEYQMEFEEEIKEIVDEDLQMYFSEKKPMIMMATTTKGSFKPIVEEEELEEDDEQVGNLPSNEQEDIECESPDTVIVSDSSGTKGLRKKIMTSVKNLDLYIMNGTTDASGKIQMIDDDDIKEALVKVLVIAEANRAELKKLNKNRRGKKGRKVKWYNPSPSYIHYGGEDGFWTPARLGLLEFYVSQKHKAIKAKEEGIPEEQMEAHLENLPMDGKLRMYWPYAQEIAAEEETTEVFLRITMDARRIHLQKEAVKEETAKAIANARSIAASRVTKSDNSFIGKLWNKDDSTEDGSDKSLEPEETNEMSSETVDIVSTALAVVNHHQEKELQDAKRRNDESNETARETPKKRQDSRQSDITTFPEDPQGIKTPAHNMQGVAQKLNDGIKSTESSNKSKMRIEKYPTSVDANLQILAGPISSSTPRQRQAGTPKAQDTSEGIPELTDNTIRGSHNEEINSSLSNANESKNESSVENNDDNEEANESSEQDDDSGISSYGIDQMFKSSYKYHGCELPVKESNEEKYVQVMNDQVTTEVLMQFEVNDRVVRDHHLMGKSQAYADYAKIIRGLYSGLSLQIMFKHVIPTHCLYSKEDERYRELKQVAMPFRFKNKIEGIYYSLLELGKWCSYMSATVENDWTSSKATCDYLEDLKQVVLHGLDWYRRQRFVGMSKQERKQELENNLNKFVKDLDIAFRKPNDGYYKTIGENVPIDLYYYLRKIVRLGKHDKCIWNQKDPEDAVFRGYKPYYNDNLNEFVVYQWYNWLSRECRNIQHGVYGNLLEWHGVFDIIKLKRMIDNRAHEIEMERGYTYGRRNSKISKLYELVRTKYDQYENKTSELEFELARRTRKWELHHYERERKYRKQLQRAMILDGQVVVERPAPMTPWEIHAEYEKAMEENKRLSHPIDSMERVGNNVAIVPTIDLTKEDDDKQDRQECNSKDDNAEEEDTKPRAVVQLGDTMKSNIERQGEGTSTRPDFFANLWKSEKKPKLNQSTDFH